LKLTVRYEHALVFAHNIHRGQWRKGTDIPYMAHLLAVSSLVLEAGGDEDQAIAGLLHDMLEDQGARTSFEEIQQLFGGEVARIVRACSDTEELPKPPWRDRKAAYLQHLDDADPAVLRVSLADKLHNSRSILTDLRENGDELWERFNASREDQLWYYQGLAAVFAQRLPSPQQRDLAEVVDKLASTEVGMVTDIQ